MTAPWQVITGDCLRVMPDVPAQSVDLLVIDPPYHRAKMDQEWDRRWKTEAEYLAWLDRCIVEFARLLKPNGSLYLFASPVMAWAVEGCVRKRFAVLNTIRWEKPSDNSDRRHVAQIVDAQVARSFYPSGERIIFAEQHGSDAPYSDALIDGNSTYWTACETAKRGIFGNYLRGEFERAGVTNRQIAALFPSASGGLTGCVSNWLLGYNCPTREQYERMRELLNERGGEYLQQDYEELQQDYEELRRKYEDLRRPFNVTADVPYTDVWDFPTVQAYPGKHVCEKPQELLRHIISVSSRAGDLVADFFAGSGSTGVAALALGRRALLGEEDPAWAERCRAACATAEAATRLSVPFRPVSTRRMVSAARQELLPL